MKSIVKFIIICLLLALPYNVSAKLIEVSNLLLYDDLTSLYWYNNISEFSGGTGGVDRALPWITTNYYGLTTWHLASVTELNSLVAGITAADFPKYFAPTNAGNFGYGNYRDLGIGNYKYWVGGTDSYSTIPGTSIPYALDVFAVRIDYSLNDLAQLTPLSMDYSLQNGTQWIRLEEVGAWVTAEGSAPVPEPSTLFLICTGMAGFAAIRQLQRTKS